MLESEIYKLEDLATIKLQNLPPESDLNLSAHLQRYEVKWDVFTSNDGGTAEAKLFRPLFEDE